VVKQPLERSQFNLQNLNETLTKQCNLIYINDAINFVCMKKKFRLYFGNFWDSPYKTVSIFTVEFFAIIVPSLSTFLYQSIIFMKQEIKDCSDDVQYFKSKSDRTDISINIANIIIICSYSRISVYFIIMFLFIARISNLNKKYNVSVVTDEHSVKREIRINLKYAMKTIVFRTNRYSKII